MGRSNIGRVTVVVDRDLLREAQRALGTTGAEATVAAALAEAARAPVSPLAGLAPWPGPAPRRSTGR
jgi:Arc/MetJ family transcription regulator